MTQHPYTIVIPSRYASSRFPGKPLHLLNGVPMILHTVARARESGAQEIVVATDDVRIEKVCREASVDVQMTREDHPSGTDRIAEVASLRGWEDDLLIVGLQGDEPATPAHHLDLLAENLRKHPSADMATLCMPIQYRSDYLNSHRVKVVRDREGMAMYFSRASIPARRDETAEEKTFPCSYLHIGLYAYRCAYLKHYPQLASCEIEKEEQLEQLRVMYNGDRIHVGEVEPSDARGVDHPDDVPVLEAVLSEKFISP